MSIDTCRSCGTPIDTDLAPEVYREELGHDCVCDSCFDDYESGKEAAATTPPAMEPIDMNPVAEAIAVGQYEFPHLQWKSADHSLSVKLATDLYTAEQLATLQAKLKHAETIAANRLIGLCKCGKEREALQAKLEQAEKDKAELLKVLDDLKEDIYRCERSGLETDIDEAIAKYKVKK